MWLSGVLRDGGTDRSPDSLKSGCSLPRASRRRADRLGYPGAVYLLQDSCQVRRRDWSPHTVPGLLQSDQDSDLSVPSPDGEVHQERVQNKFHEGVTLPLESQRWDYPTVFLFVFCGIGAEIKCIW